VPLTKPPLWTLSVPLETVVVPARTPVPLTSTFDQASVPRSSQLQA
jgi:hypothetical protein